MPDRILTSHAGSLPRPEDLIALNEQRADGRVHRRGGVPGHAARGGRRRGRAAARDRHRPGQRRRVRALDGPALRLRLLVDLRVPAAVRRRADADDARGDTAATAKPGEIKLASFGERRDWQAFAEAYRTRPSGASLPQPRHDDRPVCRGPITYQGQQDVQRDIADMKAAMAAAGVSDGYLNSVAPASCARFGNEYYADDEEMLCACADAMREEYTAIIDAGLILQLDDPAIAENWDQINPAPSVADYRRFTGSASRR